MTPPPPFWAWTFWIPGARLAGFIKGTNKQFATYKIYNLWAVGLMVSEKICFSYKSTGANDLDFEYSYTFIYSFSCLHLPTFRSQA